jgi:UTP--glucose-1-phosphate uridylyltransferase
MKIRKAVITAAGPDQHRLPLQRFIDINGQEKTALQIIIEEVAAAGVEEIGVVIRCGDQPAYAEAAGDFARMLTFVEQPQPRGYGEALYRAARFVGDEPFVHLVSDHLYISKYGAAAAPGLSARAEDFGSIPENYIEGQGASDIRCSEQLVNAAQLENCSVSAVQATRESMLRYYGAVGGRRVAGRTDLYTIERVLEKPTPTEAEQSVVVPGLRAGHYLCLFGMHVLTPTVMEILGQSVAASSASDGQPIMLSPAMEKLAQRERYLALELQGTRYNIGLKYGMLMAQLALALQGKDREKILAYVLDLVAGRVQGTM